MSEHPPDVAHRSELPEEPIDRIARVWNQFLHVELAGGIVLLVATCAALVLSNSPAGEAVHHFWLTPVGIEIGSFQLRLSLEHWINDGLMTIFFFVIGLEVKRELVLGELRDPRRALLPIAAAIGGMVVPAGVYLFLQHGKPGAAGWGIPMATDIAFVVGCMALLGPRVPHGLRVMLLSLAIVDDIGAILVIAVGYSGGVRFGWLAFGLAGFAVVYAFGRVGIRSKAVYAVVGVLIWYAFLRSNVHATISGVILGLMTPARSYVSAGRFARFLERFMEVFRGGDWERERHRAEQVHRLQAVAAETISPLEYLETALHPWVAFVIMPVFALANAGVVLRLSEAESSVAIAVGLGLLLGKPLGITLAALVSVKLGLAALPEGVGWRMIVAGGALSGIGFTMALFIAGLALDASLLPMGKVGVLLGSVLSAAAGMSLMLLFSRSSRSPAPEASQ